MWERFLRTRSDANPSSLLSSQNKGLDRIRGGDGSTKHVAEMLEIVREISEKEGITFKVATIDAGIDRSLIKQRIENGKVSPCGPLPNLQVDEVDRAVDVVAQMGAEP